MGKASFSSRFALPALLMNAAILGGCSQSVSAVLPEAPSVTQTGSLSADEQKKAIDELVARRSQQDTDARQQAKTQR